MSKTQHRYIVVEGVLYRISEANRRRALEQVRDSNATEVELDPDEYGMVEVSNQPVEDWTELTSAMAETLLAPETPPTA